MFDTILETVSSLSWRTRVHDLIKKLEPDTRIGPILYDVLMNHGPETRCFMLWACEELKKTNENILYLEIGTRRGWSAVSVASVFPQCEMYCFDIWEENYCEVPNPGPEFVQGELEKVGYTSKAKFISGDSMKTIPEFFINNNKQFDLILVDGSHFVNDAIKDLNNTMPHCKVGGYVVFDDIALSPGLDKVWYDMKDTFSNFEYYSFIGNVPGVGIAKRIS